MLLRCVGSSCPQVFNLYSPVSIPLNLHGLQAKDGAQLQVALALQQSPIAHQQCPGVAADCTHLPPIGGLPAAALRSVAPAASLHLALVLVQLLLLMRQPGVELLFGAALGGGATFTVPAALALVAAEVKHPGRQGAATEGAPAALAAEHGRER